MEANGSTRDEPQRPPISDDDLLDWSLGHLESPGREAVEERLADSPDLRQRVDAVHRTLAVLDKYKVEPAGDDLADRVRRHVAEARGRTPERKLLRPSLFSFAEIGAAAAAILLLTLVFVPGAMRARWMKQRVACEANMRSIGVALEHYANNHDRMLPFPDLAAGGNWLARDNGRHPTGTAPLFILVRDKAVQSSDMVCPACSDRPFVGETAGLVDFPSAEFVSYSFQNLYGAATPIVQDRARPRPVLADRNPLFRDGQFCSDVATTSNSFNHGRDEGQNVLFTDGRVRWVDRPEVDGDNIWQAGSTRSYKGTETATSATDWFFAP
ncbi:MAG: hypothetical protein PHU85_10325 [Phycisphaerae bacterium]|nr:hypothetical protein [Phycisphaerae bacterium]